MSPSRLLPLLLATACEPAVSDGPIVDLAFAENPDNTLSVWATWTTEVPATSTVRFGVSANPEFEVADPTLTTEHRVLVYGLREAEAYQGYAVSETADGVTFTSDGAAFSAGVLPLDWLRAAAVTVEPDRMEPGWTLCSLATGMITQTVLVMVDAEGEPRWYHIEQWDASFPDIQVSLVEDGVAFGPGVPAGEAPGVIALSGARAWDGPTQPDGTFDGRMHHVFGALPDDTFVTAWNVANGGGASADVLRIVDRDLTVQWEWSFADQLDPHDYEEAGEWTSVNSVDVDLDAGVAYIHARWLDLVFAVSLADDTVLWQLGQGIHGDFSGDPAAGYPWFQGAHAVKRLPDGNILLYDNGDSMDPAFTDREYSRVVEYRIDEDTFTSEIVWEYPGTYSSERWFSNTWGDADRLPNGNTLIDLGNVDPYASRPDTPRARLIEVDADGEVVWDLRWDTDAGVEGAYQVERIPVLLRGVGG